MSKHRYSSAVVAALFTFTALSLQAADTAPVAASLDVSAPPAARHALSQQWYYGLRIEFELTDEREYDLNRAAADRLSVISPVKPSFALAWLGEGPLSAYANFEAIKDHVMIDDLGTANTAPGLALDKVHATYTEGSFQLRAGRQRFKTTREWMFDDTIDGVRASLNQTDFILTAALFRERAFTENLLDQDIDKRIDHTWLGVTIPKSKDLEIGAYLLRQIDRDRNEGVDWFGVDLGGEWEELDYWLQAALSRADKRGQQGSGLGINAGGVYRLIKNPRIFAIANYAFGSGNANDVDLGFRQTDMQDNSAKLGGVTRLAYYGEVLDPELSNLTIVSIGLGIRPIRDASLIAMWHSYRQQHALDELRESDLSVEPNGLSRDVGNAFDLVIGYRIHPVLRAELVLGKFMPGPAFDTRSSASLVNFSVRYNF